MSSTNDSIDLNAQNYGQETRTFMGKYQWRPQYLTQTVYYNTVAAILANAMVCPAVFVCNALVILCVVKVPRLRRIKSNVLLSLLAVTDLVVGAIVCPLFIASLSCQISGQCDSCQIDSATFFLLIICSFSSLFHLVLIALDRFIAIRFALRYKGLVTIRKMFAGTIVAWTMAFVVSLSPLYSSSFSKYIFLLFVTISVLVICSCYASVYFESQKHTKNIKTQFPHGQQSNSRLHEFKAAKTTFIVTASILIYLTPSVIALCRKANGYRDNPSKARNFYFIRQAWLCTVLMLNSLSNPLI